MSILRRSKTKVKEDEAIKRKQPRIEAVRVMVDYDEWLIVEWPSDFQYSMGINPNL